MLYVTWKEKCAGKYSKNELTRYLLHSVKQAASWLSQKDTFLVFFCFLKLGVIQFYTRPLSTVGMEMKEISM